MKEQLHWHFRRYGREGAVLLLDLKGFFPNAPHALLYQRHQEFIPNPDLRALADMVIQTSPCPTPGRGLPLGVEPSQQEMVAMPSAIDNWIKCQAGVHCFGHYMDDYYLILPDVEALKKLGHEIVRRFEAAGIRVNKRKCKIIPLTNVFRITLPKKVGHPRKPPAFGAKRVIRLKNGPNGSPPSERTIRIPWAQR